MRREAPSGNIAIQPQIARAIHLPHAAGAEGREDLVWTESTAGAEAHEWRTLAPAGRGVGKVIMRATRAPWTEIECVGAHEAHGGRGAGRRTSRLKRSARN